MDNVGQGYSLFFHIPDYVLHAQAQEGMHKHYGDSHSETEHCGNQRLRNTAGHHTRITSAIKGDDVKRADHTGHRAQKP